ncbi:uncharacterized protein LY89DRAFT_732174 [Mollisia scopiformis]|uniref:BTB domain-containing protein n=1 Tax=Mollisia scopiformis TaxID=149040 RepID=A0A194XEK3_MOLSC|nr:uncharacterized protein LY89DRAFT_732174 [Mollisia scopiformis]KUJ18620.1 hypothetical protein LY89DRAFT_732174 [Mollisia scopiformis]
MAEHTFTFDTAGDLTLVVGTELEGVEQQTFLICSKDLSRSSPVFKVMLYGPFKEAQNSTSACPWTVGLPEDNPVAFKTFLHIMHSQFEEVPDVLGLKDIRDLLELSNKYDMVHLLRPWAKTWFQPHVTTQQVID